MKKIVLVFVIVLIVAAGGFGWYYFYGPCGTTKVTQANEELTRVIEDFYDGIDVASSTPRISLSPPDPC